MNPLCDVTSLTSYFFIFFTSLELSITAQKILIVHVSQKHLVDTHLQLPLGIVTPGDVIN